MSFITILDIAGMYPFSTNIDFEKISENYYLVKQMDVYKNQDFYKTLFSMDIEIKDTITEELLNLNINPVSTREQFIVRFKNPAEEIQFLLSFKNYKDRS